MKFRLDAQHYIHDRLLEPNTIIGDETDIPMVLANGDPLKPSVNMTPLDDEARALFKETFPGSRLPERDPTKAIPLRGTGDTAKQPGTTNVVQPVSPGQHTPVLEPKPEAKPDPNAGLGKPTVPPKPDQDPSLANKGGATDAAAKANTPETKK